MFRKKLRLWNIPFKFQKIICGYIADFYLPQYNLIVEIDGAAHYTYKQARDKKRDAVLRAAGFSVLRIRNGEVKDYKKEDIIAAVEPTAPMISDKEYFTSYLASLH